MFMLSRTFCSFFLSYSTLALAGMRGGVIKWLAKIERGFKDNGSGRI
jgi:hypothetical protein